MAQVGLRLGVEATIRNIDRDVSIRTVHASRGKVTRAEPISALYEQERVSHVGRFPTSKTKCAVSQATSTGIRRVTRLIVSMHRFGH